MELFMRHLGIAVRVVLLGFALLSSASAIAQTDKTPPANPLLVSEFPCPDPHVFTDGSDWYIFGTGAQPFLLHGKEFGEGKMKKVFLDLDYSAYGREGCKHGIHISFHDEDRQRIGPRLNF